MRGRQAGPQASAPSALAAEAAAAEPAASQDTTPDDNGQPITAPQLELAGVN
jgi:hypothetical protein